MHKPTAQEVMLVALLLVSVAVWMVVLLLLTEVTYQLLDTLRFIVELAQMS